MSETTHNFWVRAATGIVFVIVVLATMLWCQASYFTLLALIAVGCAWEFWKLTSGNARLIGILYIVTALVIMAFFERPFAVVFILVVWTNDIFAYLVGVTLGRHKMSPNLSPHKTWEGFAGGITGAVAMAIGLGKLFESSPLPTMSLWLWAAFGLMMALAAVAGDLVESYFKRRAGVKDSGMLLPGHGGLLDRFDAMLLAAPVASVFMILFLR